MTQEELMGKIKEFEDSLTPEQRLEWLREMNQKIKEMNDDVKGIISAVQEVQDAKNLDDLHLKLQT